MPGGGSGAKQNLRIYSGWEEEAAHLEMGEMSNYYLNV
jgi:hypothetical protein